MDKNEFKELIKSVAEIKDLKPTSTGVRLDENSGGEVFYKGEWITVGKEGNPTLGFKFVRLKDQFRSCELGCGEIVANQIIEKRLCTHPHNHWRTRCNSCDCFVSPDGKGFIKGGPKVQQAYITYFNQLKNAGKSNKQEDR